MVTDLVRRVIYIYIYTQKPKDRERDGQRGPPGPLGFGIRIYYIFILFEPLVIQRARTRETLHKKTLYLLLPDSFYPSPSSPTHTNTRARANNNGPNNNKYNCELSSSLKLYHTTIIIRMRFFFSFYPLPFPHSLTNFCRTHTSAHCVCGRCADSKTPRTTCR